MKKRKYVGLLGGTIVGLLFMRRNSWDQIDASFSVTLGMIGYAVGGLFGVNSATPGGQELIRLNKEWQYRRLTGHQVPEVQ